MLNSQPMELFKLVFWWLHRWKIVEQETEFTNLEEVVLKLEVYIFTEDLIEECSERIWEIEAEHILTENGVNQVPEYLCLCNGWSCNS